jgi:hypothetical protein
MFIVREFNDIDHFTPLLDAFCSRNYYNVSLLASNLLITEVENENLNYLKNEYGLSLEFLFAKNNLTIWHKILRKIYLSIHTRALRMVLLKKLRWIVDRILVLILLIMARQQIKSDSNWAEDIIKEASPNVIIIDWTSPDNFPYKDIVEIAKSESIPVVALPHGLNVWTNHDNTVEKKNSRNISYEGVDYVISQGSLATSHLKKGGWPSEKIIEIGSMRFSREWLAKYGEIFTKKKLTIIDTVDKIKIVMFLSKTKYKANINILKKYIKFLASRDDVSLVIKPHTRRMQVDFLGKIIADYSVYLSYDASSYELSQWCDMGIVYGSSIGLQILADRKLLIYPTEFDGNHSIYEEYSSACIVNNLENMDKLLNNFKGQNQFDYYTQENVDNLFKNVVYAGKLERNPIKEQMDFLDTLTPKQKAA